VCAWGKQEEYGTPDTFANPTMTLAIIGHWQGHQLRAVTSTVETVEKVKTSQLQVGRRDGKGFGRGYVGEKGENMKRTRYITGTNYKPTRPINFQI